MKRYQLLLPALPCTGVFADATLHAKPARNPIIRADVPDFAAIRVCDTYYMSSTITHMRPGPLYLQGNHGSASFWTNVLTPILKE
jgi:hypothetical protein